MLGLLLLLGAALDLSLQRLSLTHLDARIRELRAEAAPHSMARHLAKAGDAALASDTDRLDAAVPVGEELVDLLAALTDAAQRAGLEMQQLTRRPDRRLSDHIALDFQLATRGTYEEWLRFVDLIHEAPRLVTVSHLILRRLAPEGSGVTRLHVNCELHAYRWLAPDPASEVSSPGPEAS